MAKRHRHLDAGERHQIHALRAQEFSIRQIAEHLKRSASTISRELARNCGPKGEYNAKAADARACARRSAASRQWRVMPDYFWDSEIWSLLRTGWSPEQIAGRRRAWALGFDVSARWIYMKIAEDRAHGGTLYKYLRHKGKKRRKRTDAGVGRIPNRVGLEARPAVVDQKSRVGDWEVDLIVGQAHQGYLLTLVERKTKWVRMCKLSDKRADTVKRAMVRLLRPYQAVVHTITADNGTEFAQQAWVAKRLGASVYFADPYASWQRGLSEHTNGLVRDYFPKRTRFTDVRPASIREVQDRLNDRPRKVLGFLTPAEAFAAARLAV